LRVRSDLRHLAAVTTTTTTTTQTMKLAATQAALLRRGKLYVEPSGSEPLEERLLQALDVDFAALGYVLSARLRARLQRLSVSRLMEVSQWAFDTLAERVGANVTHVPLFMFFPDGIPDDTVELWWTRVLSHFLQAPGQPCVHCRRTGTTHVLDPCAHIVCDQCFDGSNYTACPICNRKVDPTSPFFKPDPKGPRAAPKEKVRFKLLDTGAEGTSVEGVERDARALVDAFCARPQAMSPNDIADLKDIVRDFDVRVLPWLPDRIVVKENMAHVFGALFREARDPMTLLPVAAAHLRTATDVLRLVAAFSGADPSLQPTRTVRTFKDPGTPRRWWGKMSEPPKRGRGRNGEIYASVLHRRFRVAKMSRPLRRALLAVLDALNADSLVEDMLRHRSYWVWLGQFLHPHEHPSRFPNVVRAFEIVRGQSPSGKPAPTFHTFAARVERAVRANNADMMMNALEARPGELARRFDHALRVAGKSARERERVLSAFTAKIDAMTTPVLLTLRALLPTRMKKAPVRIFWPKGGAARAPSQPDERPLLSSDVVAPAVRAIDVELLRRFALKPAFEQALIDRQLEEIVVPFNERTASRSAVALPRGSRVDVPASKAVRLFLHWCEPEKGGTRTDIDLSVGFYDDAWRYVGVCSYYQLKGEVNGKSVAKSSGDFTSAPFPDGASEFVDVDRAAALKAGARFAVMVVNNYSGMTFTALARGFAGLMLRDDLGGSHFDPRSVELKFDLQGDNGVFLPLVLDMRDDVIHWIDAYSKGMPALNNVEKSNTAITKVCPELIDYFAWGARASMLDLALLHAAARCSRVFVRSSAAVHRFERGPQEDALAFLARLRTGATAANGAIQGAAALAELDATKPWFAALLHGDVDVPDGSTAYALFRERITTSIAAADLLS
jgi:hypothetical protein